MKEKRWLKYLCVFALALLIAIPVTGAREAYAATKSGSCGDKATYQLNESTGEMTISGSGTVEFTEDWIEIGSKVKKLVIGDNITAIGKGAFYYYFSNVKTVTIGKKCKSIGAYAFEGCVKLTTVDMGSSSVKTIGYSAFQFCMKLKNITFSKKVTSIGMCAFYDCEKLKNITLPSSLQKIGAAAFAYSGLTSVTIPKNVTLIGKQAFSYCTNLKTVTIGSGVKTLRSSAFEYCSSLKTVTFKGTAPKTIGKEVFDGVTATVKYPASRQKSWTKSVRSKLKKNADLTFKTY